MPIPISNDPRLWFDDDNGYYEKRSPITTGEFDATFHMGKNGMAVLTLKNGTELMFGIDEVERFAATLRLHQVQWVDTKAKMEGYTWLPEWQDFIHQAVNLAFPTQ